MQASAEDIRTKEDGASRRFGTCEPKKMMTLLKSLGPIQNCNFSWGSNRIDLKQKELDGAKCSGDALLAEERHRNNK